MIFDHMNNHVLECKQLCYMHVLLISYLRATGKYYLRGKSKIKTKQNKIKQNKQKQNNNNKTKSSAYPWYNQTKTFCPLLLAPLHFCDFVICETGAVN